MSKSESNEALKATFSINMAAILVYWAFRLLGANKDYAWKRARLIVGNAILDKTVESIGIKDPRHHGKDGVQAFFEGGKADGETRFVDDCGGVGIGQENPEPGDLRQHMYRRTDRMRGEQVVFEYRGLMIMPEVATDLDDMPIAA